jgi:UDP:flavonoid glycosyltransferase YjiC (YdhE family)
MRVLFTASAGPAEPFAATPLAWAFRAAGHEVLVAAAPSRAEEISRTGLPVTVTGPDSGPRPAVPDYTRPSASWSSVDEVVDVARRWCPDLVIQDDGSWAGTVAGAVLGVLVLSHVGGDPGTSQARGIPASRYAQVVARYGVEPCRDAAATVDHWPPSLAVPVTGTRLSARFVPVDGPDAVPASLLARTATPRVCVAWDSVADQEGLLGTVVEAISTLDAEVVVCGRAVSELSGALPAAAPLGTLLSTCDAVVHQGQAYTTLTAAAAGTPQLLLPSSPGESMLADRIEEVGAGRRLHADVVPDGDPGTDLIGYGVAKLLDVPTYGAAARRLQAEISAQPAPAELVSTLVEWARRRDGVVAVAQ